MELAVRLVSLVEEIDRFSVMVNDKNSAYSMNIPVQVVSKCADEFTTR